MGLASSPRIFTEFMHFPVWAIKNDKPELYYKYIDAPKIASYVYRKDADISFDENTQQFKVALIDIYVDDLFGGHSDPTIAQQQWDHSELVLSDFGLPTKKAKGRPPNPINILLGKEYNMFLQWVRLSDVKFKKYVELLKKVFDLSDIPVRLLAKVVGKARHMGSIYRPLLAFARGIEIYFNPNYGDKSKSQLIDYDRTIKNNKNLKSDLLSLLEAMRKANQFGVPFSYFSRSIKNPDISIHTDASLNIGIGATFSNGCYIQEHWNNIELFNNKRDIVFKELAAIYTALHTLKDIYKNNLFDKTIELYTDNKACMYMLIYMRSKLYRPDLQKLINGICHLLLDYRLLMYSKHISTKKNIYADGLSRYFKDPFKDKKYLFKEHFECKSYLQKASNITKEFDLDKRCLSFEDDDI